MGANLCCLRKPSSEKLLKQDAHEGQTTSFNELKKPKWIQKDEKKMKQRELHPRERVSTMMRKLTLEEWLSISSPDLDMRGGEELFVLKHFSHKIFLSASTSVYADSTSKDSFLKRVAVNVDEMAKGDMGLSSHDISQCGNMKKNKKVRFRLPEKDDIVTF